MDCINTKRLVYVVLDKTPLPPTPYSDSVIAIDLENGEIKWHYQATAGDTYNGAWSQFPRYVLLAFKLTDKQTE